MAGDSALLILSKEMPALAKVFAHHRWGHGLPCPILTPGSEAGTASRADRPPILDSVID